MKNFSRILLVAIVAVGGGLSGCKKKEKVKEPSAMELLATDMAELRSREHPGFAVYDRRSGGKFSRFFGGTATSDLASYLDARVRYFFDPEDRDTFVYPAYAFEQEWIRNSANDANGARADAKVMAANYGIMGWLAGLTLGTQVRFRIRDEWIPVASTRVGIVMLGEGFRAKAYDSSSGRWYPLPSLVRQETLLHEARHSDCSGGITRAFLAKLKEVRSKADMNALAAETACGHMHVVCPEGHDYAGLQACDREDWGAYTAGELFSRGVREDPGLDEFEYQVATAMMIDYASRTAPYGFKKPDEGSPEAPRFEAMDMSSSGVKEW